MATVTIGGTVRARRRELALTQSEVAELAEVSERFIRDLESGKASVRLDKTLEVLRVLGLILDVQRRPTP